MKTAVVVPNYNGESLLRDCLDSLRLQTLSHTAIVVDNGSSDSSKEIVSSYGESVVLISLNKNYGFTGGVNAGIQYALENDFEAVALLNNDAVAENNWLELLEKHLTGSTGIVTGLIMESDKKTIDTAGIALSSWGLPYPRFYKSPDYQSLNKEFVLGASGGASLYSSEMLREIGLFDDDFFAYYEDVDLSLRAQFRGWKVFFDPEARVYHKTSSTSRRWPGFRTYQMFKNLRLLVTKTTPPVWRSTIYPRFYLAYSLFQLKALFSRDAWYMLKGSTKGILLSPKKLNEKRAIVKNIKVNDDYLISLLTFDLPPNQPGLRKLRLTINKIRGRV